MASVKHLKDRKYRAFLFDGSWPDGRKKTKSVLIYVPPDVAQRAMRAWALAEAVKLEEDFRHDYSRKAFLTFQEYALDWIDRVQGIKPLTKKGYRRSLGVVCEFIGRIPITEVRPIDIERMSAKLHERNSMRGGNKLSESSIHQYLQCTSSVFSDAVRNRIVLCNPVLIAHVPRLTKKSTYIPDMEQMKELLAVISDEPTVFRCYFLLAFMMAARRGEVCALKWQDVTNDGITIRRNLVRLPKEGLTEGTPKNGKCRTVGMTDEMKNVLADMMVYHRSMFGAVKADNYIFAKEDGKPYDPNLMTKRFKQLVRKAGLPEEFHLHGLRHCAITTMLENGMSKQVVADIAGHYSTDFLEATYCHPRMDKKIEAAQCVSAFVHDCTNNDPDDACAQVSEPAPIFVVATTAKQRRNLDARTPYYISNTG